jgi:pyrimidine deaminase RibD-like protein
MGVDVELMREAIRWAQGCSPKNKSTPKVGAIIAVSGKVIGRGRRGTGTEGDDEHAEQQALHKVFDKSELPQATLYTTLEPCTPEVRTKECCTELILQHEIKKVFIGILDPNQGVAGKGLLKLQSSGVAVELFTPELAQQIRAINAAFIGCQQTLGASIMSPKNGEILETYKTRGNHTIRFKCLNPPTVNNHLLTSRDGLYWPQRAQFRHIERNEWAIDAHFFLGTGGDYTLHIVTATELGHALIEYYWKVVSMNVERRNMLSRKLSKEDREVLHYAYTGISMTGLPKGLRSEASVPVTIAENPATPRK